MEIFKCDHIVKINKDSATKIKMRTCIDTLVDAIDNKWNNLLFIDDSMDVTNILNTFIDKYDNNYDVLQLIIPDDSKIIYNTNE